MSVYLILLALAAAIYFISQLLRRTDIPHIKGLPELPGVPVFGSLFLLGRHHARNCTELAKKYGPVFQVCLGSRVSINHFTDSTSLISGPQANRLCEYV